MKTREVSKNAEHGSYVIARGKSMPALELAILYRGHGGRPLRLASIRNRSLLGAAASAAVREAEHEAAVLSQRDATLGQLQMREAEILREVLSPVIGLGPMLM